MGGRGKPCGRRPQVVASLLVFSEKWGLPQGDLPSQDPGFLGEPAVCPTLPHPVPTPRAGLWSPTCLSHPGPIRSVRLQGPRAIWARQD